MAEDPQYTTSGNIRQSESSSIRSKIARQLRSNTYFRYIVSIALLLIVWEIGGSFTNELFLPTATATVIDMYALTQDGTLQSHIGITVFRILVGCLIGSVLGVGIGWTLGYSPVARSIFEPYINFFRGLPPIIWISLVVIWIGYNEIARISLVAYAVFFVVVVGTLDSVVEVDEQRVRAARSLGASKLESHLYVRIPASIPEVFSTVRVGLGIGAMSIIAVEMLISNQGVGYMVWMARTYLQTTHVFVGIITLGFIAYGINYLYRVLGARLLGKYGVRKSGESS
jgi:NitT/TauT family transport system permease protein